MLLQEQLLPLRADRGMDSSQLRLALDPSIRTLSDLGQAEAACRRCPLNEFATQIVPGEGHKQAALMLVGEQPGDRED